MNAVLFCHIPRATPGKEFMIDMILSWIAIAVIVYVVVRIAKTPGKSAEEVKRERETFELQRERQKKIDTYGYISPAMICPHCQTKGNVSTMAVKRKKGVSGAKVTGMLLTCGVSVLATGLSRKEGLTQAHCANCGAQWDF